MKQVLLRGGKAVVEDVPAPCLDMGQVLVRVAWSCVSPGTELVSAAATSRGKMVERIRRNPAKARQAFKLLQEQGLRKFSHMAQEKLAAHKLSGYSCAGVVEEVSPGVEELLKGDRVACAGAGFANHAEVVAVPSNLVAKIPDGVAFSDASTVTLGAIALQGVRRAQVTLGERIGVIGLGFVGQLTIQLLKAAGCKVLGTDLEPHRVRQAEALGADVALAGGDAVAAAYQFSDDYGLDAVILTAATPSDEPLHLAMQMARRKGRVVIVGVVGLGIRREAMYAKELDLVMSTSYGPGRYDRSYEEEGLDYPYAYVRWTENRNMQAFLELIASGQVDLATLTSERLPVAEAEAAYELLQTGSPRPYTVLLHYPQQTEDSLVRRVALSSPGPMRDGAVRLAILGAGGFARNVHFPNLRRLSDRFCIDTVVTRHGPTAVAAATAIGAQGAGTDYHTVLQDDQVDAVLIATRHHLHARMVAEALQAGKHVFVEKPLALTTDELDMLVALVQDLRQSEQGCPVVFVGFNRRYSPYAVQIRRLIESRSVPLQITYRMNAGYQPPEHWSHGDEGGGRLLGEACHIFDLFRFLTAAPAVDISAMGLKSARSDVGSTDNFTATVRYADGSVCTLLYTAQGGSELPKEALELHVDRHSVILDDYKALYGFNTPAKRQTKRQGKGHYEELIAFHQAMSGTLDRYVIWEEALEVTRTTLEVDRLVRYG